MAKPKMTSPEPKNPKKVTQKLSDKELAAEAEAIGNRAEKKQVILKQKTINLPEDVLIALEDMARDNKRSGAELNTASAIMRYALAEFFKTQLDS